MIKKKEVDKAIGDKAMYLSIPIDLYNLYAKICADLGITKKEGFLRYLKYLEKKHN